MRRAGDGQEKLRDRNDLPSAALLLGWRRAQPSVKGPPCWKQSRPLGWGAKSLSRRLQTSIVVDVQPLRH